MDVWRCHHVLHSCNATSPHFFIRILSEAFWACRVVTILSCNRCSVDDDSCPPRHLRSPYSCVGAHDTLTEDRRLSIFYLSSILVDLRIIGICFCYMTLRLPWQCAVVVMIFHSWQSFGLPCSVLTLLSFACGMSSCLVGATRLLLVSLQTPRPQLTIRLIRRSCLVCSDGIRCCSDVLLVLHLIPDVFAHSHAYRWP